MSFQSAHPTPAGVSLSTFVGRLIPFQPTDGGMHSRSENQGRRPQTRVPLHATSWSRRSRRSCGSPPCPPERAFSLRVYRIPHSKQTSHSEASFLLNFRLIFAYNTPVRKRPPCSICIRFFAGFLAATCAAIIAGIGH